MLIPQYSRQQIKISTVTGAVPTIPLTDDHTAGGWIETDIYEGELFLNSPDERLFIRTQNGIKEIIYSGSTLTFLSLSDTPLSYTGEAGKMIVVNSGETALEFLDIPTTGTTLNRVDMPWVSASTLSLPSDSATTIFFDETGELNLMLSDGTYAPLTPGNTYVPLVGDCDIYDDKTFVDDVYIQGNLFVNGLSGLTGITITGAGGSDTTIQYNNSGSLSGDTNFIYDKTNKSVTLGSRLGSIGLGSVVMGDGNEARGEYSQSNGYNNISYSNYSYTEGTNNIASAITAHSEGYSNIASGLASHVEGKDNISSGEASHAEGYYNTASGQNSHAEGDSNTSSGLASHAEGSDNIASGDYSHASGAGSRASRDYQYSHGGGFFSGGILGEAQYSRIIYQVESTTTGNTILATFPTETNKIYGMRFLGVAVTVDGIYSGTTAVFGGYNTNDPRSECGYVKNIGGIIKKSNNFAKIYAVDDGNGTDSTFPGQKYLVMATSGTDVIIRCVGVASTTIRWVLTLEWTEVGF